MCTVVVRSKPHDPLLVLALRDELTGRAFDDPDQWWPDQPGIVGGRDRQAGGTWCVTDVASGVTALVLNRFRHPVAEPGAPSRGVLPLLAVRHGLDWTAHLSTSGMAGFALVLASAQSLTLWEFDGSVLTSTDLPEGTHLFTAGGAEDGKADRHLPAFRAAGTAGQWQSIVASSVVQDDPAALLVRHQHGDSTFATVFGQVMEAGAGRLSLSYSRTPSAPATWTTRCWPAD